MRHGAPLLPHTQAVDWHAVPQRLARVHAQNRVQLDVPQLGQVALGRVQQLRLCRLLLVEVLLERPKQPQDSAGVVAEVERGGLCRPQLSLNLLGARGNGRRAPMRTVGQRVTLLPVEQQLPLIIREGAHQRACGVRGAARKRRRRGRRARHRHFLRLEPHDGRRCRTLAEHRTREDKHVLPARLHQRARRTQRRERRPEQQDLLRLWNSNSLLQSRRQVADGCIHCEVQASVKRAPTQRVVHAHIKKRASTLLAPRGWGCAAPAAPTARCGITGHIYTVDSPPRRARCGRNARSRRRRR
mmetsp:Transcript_10565/g.36869  ORF Transcript_10565/g.36869 Transcript_10565/m.36869 type:complete len:300 (+) Transcript_10565:2479-3378(+)